MIETTRVLLTLPMTLWTPSAISLLLDAGCSGVRMIAKGVTANDYRNAINMVLSSAVGARPDRPFQVVVDMPGGRPRFAGDFWRRQTQKGEVFELVNCDQMRRTESPSGPMLPVVGLTAEIAAGLRRGSRVVTGDGEVVLEVIEATSKGVKVMTTSGGEIRATRSINLPDTEQQYESFTDVDLGFVRNLGDVQGLHLYLSMVSNPAEISRVRELTGDAFVSIGAKIETRRGVAIADRIAAAADRVVVGRGDLGVELLPIEVVNATERIAAIARDAGKPLTVASRFLMSLVNGEQPSIPDVIDLQHHVRMGADEILLSGEICYEEPWKAVRWARQAISEVQPLVPSRATA